MEWNATGSLGRWALTPSASGWNRVFKWPQRARQKTLTNGLRPGSFWARIVAPPGLDSEVGGALVTYARARGLGSPLELSVSGGRPETGLPLRGSRRSYRWVAR